MNRAAGSLAPYSVGGAEPGFRVDDGDDPARSVDRPEHAAGNQPTSSRAHPARFGCKRVAGNAVNGRTPADDGSRMRGVSGGNAVFAP